MKTALLTVLASIALASLVGCTNNQLGTAGGAVGGGVIGSAVSHGNPFATVGGAVVGGLVGNELTK